MSDHDGLNGLDAAKVKEIQEATIKGAVARVQRFMGQLQPGTTGADVVFKDADAFDATVVLADLYLTGVDFTDEIKQYGWSLREFRIPRNPQCLAVQLITPLGHIAVWRHEDAEQIVEAALTELSKMQGVGGLMGSSRFSWLRTMAYGWGLVRRAFLLKKEY